MSDIYSWSDPQGEQDELGQYVGREKMLASLTGSANAELANRVAQIYRDNPWMDPGVVLSLAKAQANYSTISGVSSIAALSSVERVEKSRNGGGKNWFQRNILDRAASGLGNAWDVTSAPLRYGWKGTKWIAGKVLPPVGKGLQWMTPDSLTKPIVKYSTAAALSFRDLVQGSPRAVTGHKVGYGEDSTFGFENKSSGFDWSDWIGQTTLGVMFSGVDSGEGYLPGKAVEEEQGRRAREYRGTTPDGSAHSLGRGTATNLDLEGDAYRFVSGFLDGAASLAITRGTTFKTAKSYTQAVRGTENIVSRAGNTNNLFGAVFRAAGKGDMSARDVADDFMKWVTTNKHAKRLVSRLAKETSPHRVLEMFDYKITVEDAERIARAMTDDEQIGLMQQLFARERLTDEDINQIREAFIAADGTFNESGFNSVMKRGMMTTEPGTLTDKIKDIPGARAQFLKNKVGETKLYRWLDKWYTEAPPGTILVRGDSRQRSGAVRDLANYLKTLGGKRVYMTERENVIEMVDNVRGSILKATDVSAPEGPLLDATAALETAVNDVKRIIGEAEGPILSSADVRKARAGVKRMREAAQKVYAARGELMPPNELYADLYGLERRIATITKNIDQTRLDSIMDRFVRAMSDGTRQGVYRSRLEVEEVLEETLRINGFSEAQIQAMKQTIIANEEEMRAYWVDEVGTMAGQGAVRAFYDAGIMDAKTVESLVGNPSMIDDVGLVGPTVMSDLLNNAIFLPDPRQVRAYNNPFWRAAMKSDSTLVKGAVATERALITAGDILVNTYWKRLALMTFGYIFRNLMDGQIRVAMLGKKATGMSGLLNHPLDYIAWSMRKNTGRGGIMGQDFDEVKDAFIQGAGVETIEDAASQDLYEAFGKSGHRQVVDPLDGTERLRKTNAAMVVDRFNAEPQHTTGVVDTLGQIGGDISMRLAMQGVPTEDFIRIIRSKENRKALRTIKDLLTDGFYVKSKNGQRARVPLDISTGEKLDKALAVWYENVVIPRVQPYMGNTREMGRLRFASMHDTVLTPTPGIGSGRTTYEQLIDEYGELLEGVDVRIGTVIPTAGTVDGMRHNLVVTDITPHPIINDATGEVIEAEYITLDTAFPGAAFGGEGMIGTESLRGAVDDAGKAGQLPERVRYIKREADLTDKESNALVTAARWVVNGFFNNVSEGAMRKLEKYPFWRQGYYHVVSENVDMLAPSEARKVLNNIERAAARAKVTPEQYVGKNIGPQQGPRAWFNKQDSVLDRLRKQAELPDDGTLTGTAEDLNAFAGRITNMNMGNIFFESARRNNVEDALRIVYPFGAAWREIIGKYGKLILEDPYRVRKAELVYRGGMNADPEGDGRGFLYKDPQSGQVMFTFPLSKQIGYLAQLGTSGPMLDVSQEAPLRQLNVGFNTLPQMGPLAQIPAAAILKDKPKLSWLLDMIAPYGAPKNTVDGLFRSATPGWASKLYEAYNGNTEEMDTMFAQTYVDTLRALSVSGEYDLTTADGQTVLMRDARSKARAIMGLRAATQFIGPTSGSPSYQVTDIQGRDIFVDVLAQELATLREEDYDTAVQRFLSAHGENFMLYLASKTRATEKGEGYEPTKEFMDWSIENKEFLDEYRKTGAFFGPSSDVFSFAAWDYQIATGKRVYNDPREIIQQAQYVVAAEAYRQERLKYGPYPNEIERERLKSVRVALNARYPGYPVNPVFEVNEFESLFIPELKKAVADSAVKDLPVSDYIRAYLEARDSAIESLGGASLKSSKRAARQRAALAFYGQQLANENNEFARLYDRQLAAEVED